MVGVSYWNPPKKKTLASSQALGNCSQLTLTQHSPLVTSGFPSMRKLNMSLSSFSIAICLLFSLLFVLSTKGLDPSSHVLFGLHGPVSRTLGIKGLDSESSTTSILAVDSVNREFIRESTARSSQVQFDNYSLILRGQRIFL